MGRYENFFIASSTSGDAKPRALARSSNSGDALAIEPLSNGGCGSY